MLKEYEERINDAKNKQFKIFERFHVGDAVYPFWLHGLVVYGTVTDIDTVARKIICDFNGVQRQFQPEDLMHVNPEIVNAATLKKRTASEKKEDDGDDETQGVYPSDTDNGIKATCKKCGGEIAVSYDEQKAKSDFVCTKCGIRISEDELSDKTKKAMRMSQKKNLCASEQPVEKFASVREIGQELARVAKILMRMGYMLTDTNKLKNDIEAAKKRLIAEAKRKGISEDFGNSEIAKLREKYDAYNWKCASLIQEFQVWCMNFDLSQLERS